jgi:hypothetical protein
MLPGHAVPRQPFEMFPNNTILQVRAPPGFVPDDSVRIRLRLTLIQEPISRMMTDPKKYSKHKTYKYASQ